MGTRAREEEKDRNSRARGTLGVGWGVLGPASRKYRPGSWILTLRPLILWHGKHFCVFPSYWRKKKDLIGKMSMSSREDNPPTPRPSVFLGTVTTMPT